MMRFRNKKSIGLVIVSALLIFIGVTSFHTFGFWGIRSVLAAERDRFAGGSGTENDPYLVETAGQLDMVRQHLDKYFKQTADIDLIGYGDGTGWEPIGYSIDPRKLSDEQKKDLRTGRLGKGFSGVFDGNGYKITSLTINRPHGTFVGLFGRIQEDGKVKNLTLDEINVKGNSYTGGLVGRHEGYLVGSRVFGTVSGGSFAGGIAGVVRRPGKLINSEAEVELKGGSYLGGLTGTNSGLIQISNAKGYIRDGSSILGGLVGMNNGDIVESYADVNIEGENIIGGLSGASRGIVLRCYAKGYVVGKAKIGGLIGINMGKSAIQDSYAMGNVMGKESLGGLVGENGGRIVNCYAIGKVVGEEKTGGITSKNETKVGENKYEGEISNSYYDSEKTEQKDLDIAKPKSTKEMRRRETFTNWDFENVWWIEEREGYPQLRWQKSDSK